MNQEYFGLVKGDIYMMFKCTRQTASIMETESCYDSVPIIISPTMFVDTQTRVFNILRPRPASWFPIDCNSNEIWIELTPKRKSVEPSIKEQPNMWSSDKMEIVSYKRTTYGDELYTKANIFDWEKNEIPQLSSILNERT